MSLAVIVPTRGRPANAHRLDEALGDVEHIFACDDDDPMLPGYQLHLESFITFPGHPTMIEKLNQVAVPLATEYDYLGFMGDDHMPRTEGWATEIEAVLAAKPPGVVYCNDLFQGPNLPTAVFLHSRIVRALGWMALPTLQHLYCDNAWLDLGRALGSCTYLPHVVIEHLHPHAGKAEGDDQYDRVNSAETTAADRAAWEEWRDHQLILDVALIRGVRVA